MLLNNSLHPSAATQKISDAMQQFFQPATIPQETIDRIVQNQLLHPEPLRLDNHPQLRPINIVQELLFNWEDENRGDYQDRMDEINERLANVVQINPNDFIIQEEPGLLARVALGFRNIMNNFF